MGQSFRRGVVGAPGALAAATFQAGSRGGGSGYLERRGKKAPGWLVCISPVCMAWSSFQTCRHHTPRSEGFHSACYSNMQTVSSVSICFRFLAFHSPLDACWVVVFSPTATPAKLVGAVRAVLPCCFRQVCLRCCSILSRAFLHHLQALTSLPGFGKLWLDTVTLLSQNLEGVSAAAAGAGGVAAESCQQILTNMVMVVAYAGLLGGQQVVGDTGETGKHRREGGLKSTYKCSNEETTAPCRCRRRSGGKRV